jgi:hypothetical protein
MYQVTNQSLDQSVNQENGQPTKQSIDKSISQLSKLHKMQTNPGPEYKPLFLSGGHTINGGSKSHLQKLRGDSFACTEHLYMGTTLPGLLLSVPYLVSEERSPSMVT